MEQSFELKHAGISIPSIGFGTWMISDGVSGVNTLMKALEAGYRHIDSAAFYGNEKSVGEAVRKSQVRREDVFVTSKVWNADRGYDRTMNAFESSLRNLRFDYLDLYLIHWPGSAHQYANWKELNAGSWKALEELHKDGKIRSIGVSNFKKHHLEALLEQADVVPAINQIEYHPGHTQDETVDYCMENGIQLEAWAPLGTGKVLSNEHLKSLATKYGKSVAQICLRWILQNNILPLPKSANPQRMKENLELWDFELSEQDMQGIKSLGNFGFSGQDPDRIGF